MFLNSLLMVTNKIQNEPGKIVGPVSKFLGYILNFIFDFAHSLTVENSLGLSIILFTIVVRMFMVPLALKQQKSMFGMQKLQPEIEKIKKKYPTQTDPEVQKKMNAEIQAIYAKSGVNPLSGCLPLVVQFPIFIALTFIMQQSFSFINKLNDIYEKIAVSILAMPDYLEKIGTLASYKIQVGKEFDITIVHNMQKVLGKFTAADWQTFLPTLPPETMTQLTPLLEQKNNIEHFFTINLLENPSLTIPALLIPVLAATATFLSSWIATKQTISNDANAKMQQKVLLIVMPIMMGYFTFTLPAGVGLYWITSSVFQLFQQIILNRYYTKVGLKPKAVTATVEEATKKPNPKPKQKSGGK